MQDQDPVPAGIKDTLANLRTFRKSLGTHTLRTDDPDPELPPDLQAVKTVFDNATPTGGGIILLDDPLQPGEPVDLEKQKAFWDTQLAGRRRLPDITENQKKILDRFTDDVQQDTPPE